MNLSVFFLIGHLFELNPDNFLLNQNRIASFFSEIQSLIESSNCTSQGYVEENLTEKKLAGFNPMDAISLLLPPPHHECSAHDLTCIRDSWTPRTFYQQATETPRPLYLHCRPAHFYILTGSRSELQQRPLLLLPAVRVHPHTLQIIFHSEMHVFKAIVSSHLRRSVFHLQACVLNL